MLAAGAWWLARARDASQAAAPLPAEPPPPVPSAGPATPSTGRPLPESLRGVELAGALPVDAAGHLRVVPEVLELFDGYLSASGEEPLGSLRARIEAEIEARLRPPADAEARALLERYLAYREAARELALSVGSAVDLERRFQLLRELRRGHFDAAEAEALFGAEEARTRVDLERRRVALDPELTPAERAERLAALDAELPPEVRETRGAVLRATHLREQERRLRAAGAREGEIRALREGMVGAEAAERLAALDAERAGFEARFADYRRERTELLARRFRDDAARAQALDALRAAHFDEREQQRVTALDRIRDAEAVD